MVRGISLIRQVIARHTNSLLAEVFLRIFTREAVTILESINEFFVSNLILVVSRNGTQCNRN